MKWELVNTINGRPWSRLQVGWYIVPESREIQQCGEYAADYWTARVESGRYPLYAFRDCGQLWHSLGVEIPGVIVSGSWWNKRQAGEPTRVHLDMYPHAVAKAIVDDGGCAVDLLDGFEARRIEFEYDGTKKHTFGIFLDGVELRNAK